MVTLYRAMICLLCSIGWRLTKELGLRPAKIWTHLQCTVIGPSWPNCSFVLCTWPTKSMNPSPDFGTPCSGQSMNWNWRTVLDWPSCTDATTSTMLHLRRSAVCLSVRYRCFFITVFIQNWQVADWNDLPVHIASAPSLMVFRLETFLFSRSNRDTINLTSWTTFPPLATHCVNYLYQLPRLKWLPCVQLHNALLMICEHCDYWIQCLLHS